MVGIKFDITGDNKNFLSAIQSSVKGVEGGIAKIEDAGKRMEDLFTGLGQSLAIAGVGLTIEQIIQKIVTMRVELEKSMKEVATLSPEIAQNLLKYTDAIDQMTTQIPIAANEGAKALYQIVSAGHDGAAGMKVLEVSAKAAVGGVTETVTAADAITTILNAYKMEGSAAESVSDALFKTVKLGKTSFGELGATIAQVAPLASSYGIRIEEVLAVVATLTKQGTPTAQAMTQIRAAITGCAKSMGDAAFSGRTLQETFAEAMKEAKGSANTLKENMGTIEAVSAILGVTGKNAKGAAGDLAEVNDAAGAAAEAFNLMNETGANQFKLLSNNIIAYLAPLGDSIADTFGRGARELNEAFADGRITETLEKVGGLVAAATAAYVTYNGAIAIHNAYQGISAVVMGLVNVQREYEIALLTAGGAMTRSQAAAIVGEISVRTVLVNAIKAQTVALLKNTAAMLTNPYVLLAGVVAGLAYAFYKLATAETEVEKLQREYQDNLQSLNDRLDEQKRKTEELINVANDEEQSSLQRDSAIQQLIKTYPGIIEKYIDEEGHLTNILELKKEIAGIEDTARMNGYENQLSSVTNKYNAQKDYVERASNVHPEDIEKLRVLESQMNELKSKVDSGWVSKFRDEYKGLGDTELQSKITELELAVKNGMGMAWTDWVTSSDGTLSSAVNRMMSTEATQKLADDLSAILAKRTKAKEEEVKNKDYWAAIKKDAEEKLEKMPDTAVNTKEWNELTAKIQDAEKHIKKYSVSSSDAINSLKQRDAYHRLEKQQELQHRRDMEDLAFDTRQAELDAQEEGLGKTLAQLKLDFDRQRTEIQRGYENLVTEKIEKARQLFESNPANKGKVFDESSVDTSYTDEEVENFCKRMNALNEGFKRNVKDATDSERSAMLDYLKEYGTYQEKKKAIAEEYSNKIAKATTEGEKKSLQEEMNEQISNLDFDKFQQEINWGAIFGDLGKYTKSQLQTLQNQLKRYKESEKYAKATDENKKVVDEALNDITNTIADKSGIFGDLAVKLNELSIAEKELAAAEKALEEASTDAEKEAAQKKKNKAQKKKEETEVEVKSAAEKSRDKIAELASTITQLGNASEMSLSDLGSLASSIAGMFGEVGEKVGGWIEAIFVICDMIAEKGIQGLAENVSTLIGGVLGGFFGIDINASSRYYEEQKKLHDNYIQLINEVISQQEELIKKQTGLDALNTYNKAAYEYEDLIKTRLQDVSNYLDSGGSKGFLGIGSSSSKGVDLYYDIQSLIANSWTDYFSYQMDQLFGDGTAKKGGNIWWNEIFGGETLEEVNFGPKDYRVKELSSVTTDQIRMMKEWKELWSMLPDDIRSYYEEILAAEEQINSLKNAFSETVTGISFDSLESNFLSALKNMLSDTESASKSIEDTLNNALFNNLMKNKYSALLQEWYGSAEDGTGFAGLLKNGINSVSNKSIEEYRQSYLNLINQAKDEAEALSQVLGIDLGESSTTTQEASSKGFTAMSQDLGQELNGRFTAVQIATEKAANEVVLMANQLSLLVSGFSVQSTTTEEIRNLMLTSNSHLEDIARLTKKIYTDFAAKLDNITDNTKNL